jgi:Gram-negative bacterial TonB protein C-terminal
MCQVSRALWAGVSYGVSLQRLLLLAAVAVSAMLFAGLARAQDIDRWGQIAAANNLENKGNKPFHMVMAVQLYGFQGEPTERGTVEKWWAAQGSERTIVHLPSLNEDGSTPKNASPAVMRDWYLVQELIEAAVHPVPSGVRPGAKVKEGAREFGKTRLSCVTPVSDLTQGSKLTTLCMTPQIDDVRALLESNGSEMIRNSIGKFGDTYVALELQISLLGQHAIAGKVTTLQSFDPATSKVQLQSSAAAGSDTFSIGRFPARVLDGKRVSFVEPSYPNIAKVGHMSGSVVLGATICKDGSVRNVAPLAYSDVIFVGAASNAVLQWKYVPYLVNGEPVEVSTTITVNFAFN